MKLKKLLSITLACVMALSLAVPAFAAVDPDTNLAQSSTITGTTKTPTIKINVPTSGNVVVNPYGMGVDLGDEEVNDQIVSATQYVTNMSDVPMAVSASVVGKIEGQLKLATATTIPEQGKTAVTTNSVYLYLEGKVTDDNTSAVDWTNSQKVVAATTAKVTKIADLAQGTGSAVASKGGYLAYRLNGDAVSAPAKAWTAADKVTVTVAFTFVPGTYVLQPSVKITGVEEVVAGTAGSMTLTATTKNLPEGVTPTYTWAATDTNSILDNFTAGTAATQAVATVSGATAGQEATIKVTVSYGSGDDAVTLEDTVTITVKASS